MVVNASRIKNDEIEVGLGFKFFDESNGFFIWKLRIFQ